MKYICIYLYVCFQENYIFYIYYLFFGSFGSSDGNRVYNIL